MQQEITLTINKSKLIQAYSNGNEAAQELLAELFGKEIVPPKITDRIKTFEDACEALGINPEDVLPNSKIERLEVTAVSKLFIIAEALNEGWKPDWRDSNQNKYMPWFEDKSGLGLSFIGVGNWNTITNIGSRLCFKSRELAEYAGKQFEDIYKQFLIIQ